MADTRRGAAPNPLRAFQLPFAAELQWLEEQRRQKLAQLAALRGSIEARVAPPRRPTVQPRSLVPARVKEEVRAAASGFADGALFGIADPASAVVKTVLGQGGSGDFGQRFSRNLAAEAAQDQYDKTHYGGARFGGQAVGTAAGLAAGGAALGGVKAARAGLPAITKGRLAPQAGHIVRLGGASGGVGGVGNAAVQASVDAATGERFTPGDFVGSVAGGVLGGVAAPFVGPGRGAALAGVATPMLQGALNSEAPNPIDVLLGFVGGSAAGRGSEVFTRRALQGMTPKQKGELGEALARADSRMLGQRVLDTQVNIPVGNRTTRADHVTLNTIDEAKFGKTRLTDPQKRARAMFGDRYVVRHYLPEDLYNANAMLAVGLGAPIIQVPEQLRLSATRPPPQPAQ